MSFKLIQKCIRYLAMAPDGTKCGCIDLIVHPSLSPRFRNLYVWTSDREPLPWPKLQQKWTPKQRGILFILLASNAHTSVSSCQDRGTITPSCYVPGLPGLRDLGRNCDVARIEDVPMWICKHSLPKQPHLSICVSFKWRLGYPKRSIWTEK